MATKGLVRVNPMRRYKSIFHIIPGLVFACLMAGAACEGSDASSQARDGGGGRWTRIDLVDRYVFKGDVLEDKDLSGIARLSDTRFLIGADEGLAVQVVELPPKAKTMKVVRTIPLAQSGGEIDIEAIACEGPWCYVTGSHGLSKKQGQRQANRYKMFRLKVDRATGMPTDVETASLWDVLRADAVLGEHFQKPLQQRGVNIEGLAIRNGRLFVGFRGPNLGGHAFVMEIGAQDVFAGRPRPEYMLHKLRLGEGLGIREIVAARSGFLIVAGNSSAEPSEKFTQAEGYDADRGFSMFAWDGADAEVHRIGTIPDTPGKAEAMTILEESETEITVLMLFDGPKGGRPSVYRLR
jgi:hypothetical protein